MKKILPYILIVFTLVNFLAPIGIGWGEKNLPKIETNITEAAGCDILNVSFDPYISSNTTIRPEVVTLNIEVTSGCVGGIIRGSIYSNEKEIMTILATKITIPKFSYTIKTGEAYCDNNKLCKITTNLEADPANTPNESDTIKYNSGNGDKDSLLYKCVAETCNNDGWVVLSQTLTSPIVGDTGIKTYYYEIKNKDGATIKTSGLTDQATCEVNKAKEDVGTTGNVVGLCVQTAVTQFTKDPINTPDAEPLPACSMTGFITGGLLSGNGTFVGCVAQTIYYVLFVPTSYLFALAGNFFDWTFAYSVNDASYRSGFVVQGWGVVRDFCNMFFIFILLYVAFTTILGTNSAKTKEMIINVVIIGLLINFSLFATQVIIDASNILARVFYNSNTIVITPAGVTNGETSGNTTGILPLSAALVNKINPQNLIINAKKVTDFSTQSNIGATQNASTDESISVGRFIIVTLLATGINVMGFLVFISVALIFVARVVGLWIAMILSPIVFFTYMVPSLKTMETIGWSKWWPETIKLAFLAPVFIFFLYIILKFLQTDLVFMTHTANETGIQMVIATVVPFAFIMVLLDRAKSIAKSMSGTIGQQVTDGLSKAGGLALGVATGGAALAGRATLGRLGSVVANSETLKKYEAKGGFGGKALRNLGTSASKGSFDARNTKAGQQFSKQTGMNMDNGSWVGAGKEKGKGGFTQARADKTAARIKRSKELEVGQDSELTKNLREAQVDEKKLLDANAPQLKKADKEIAAKKEALNNANMALQANPIDKDNATQPEKDAHKILEAIAKAANIEYQEELNKKKAIRDGGVKTGASLNSDGTYQYNTNNGNISKKEFERVEKENNEAQAKATAARTAATAATANVATVGNGTPGSGTAATNRKKDEDDADVKERTADDAARATEDAKLAEAMKTESAAIAALATAMMALKADPSTINTNSATIAKNNADAATAHINTLKGTGAGSSMEAIRQAHDKAEQNRLKAYADAATKETSAIATATQARLDAIATQTTAVATAITTSNEKTLADASRSKGQGRSLAELQTEDIPDAQNAIEKENNERKTNYAEYIGKSKFNKTKNLLSTGLVHSLNGDAEASHRIMMDAKE